MLTKRYCQSLVFLILGACVIPAWAQKQEAASKDATPCAATCDTAAFLNELHGLSGVLQKKPAKSEIEQRLGSLPKNWTVTSAERTYSISTQSLRDLLTSGDIEKAQAWLAHLESETKSFTQAQPALPANARDDLQRILARPEFGAVHAPSAWELLRQRITVWIAQQLLRFFSMMGRYPIGGKILFWVIVIGSILLIAVWLFRFWGTRNPMQTLHRGEPLPASRTWQEWFRTAREAANRGDFREAVHSCYWAGIVRLEDIGAVPKDRTKTPREYLRLASEPAPGELAPRPRAREPLAALTSRLERTWYANRGAGPEDFQDAMRQLEALGCPLS